MPSRPSIGLVAALLLAGCAAETPPDAPSGPAAERSPAPEDRAAVPARAAVGELSSEQIPSSMRSCYGCHKSEVETYLMGHGMSGSVGPVGEPPPGTVVNPRSGNRYEIASNARGAWLTATFPDGGQRVQRLVGRIGAGIFDVSWVGAETGVLSDEVTGRLFFAPVETVTGHGNELSPFELQEGSAGLDLALTEGCLTCHTDSDLGKLPGASVPSRRPETRYLFPSNGLGAEAFEHLEAPGCEACHGDPAAHLELVNQGEESLFGDAGLDRLGEQPAGRQRDVCARCHLQGDARIDLGGGQVAHLAGPPGEPLAGRIPVLVPARQDDDFRFVGQLERLVESACFQGSPRMTCTTCHDPHRGVASQGLENLEAACSQCHDCSRDPALEVAAVIGEPARTAAGCVDCHVRRSQPFDLPHVRAADHYIRRHIPPAEHDIPHRQFAHPDGELEIFDDDGRLARVLQGPDGERWRSGVQAMGLLTLGRIKEAARHFDAFPEPGTEAARTPSAPPGVLPFETHPPFHQTRALALMASGRFPEALAAFTDALELDPLSPGALMGRARLRFDTGDAAGALADTQILIETYPDAEQPWELRATIAERLGRADLATAAFEASTARWPSNAVSWYKLGLLLEQRGDLEGARAAIEQARVLQPSLDLPGAGPVSAR